MPQSQVNKSLPAQPPMSGLLALLRQSGFLATTDDYVDLLKIIELYGHEGLDSLSQRICPIIAMSPEEQERFYNVFEGYKAAQQSGPEKPPENFRWVWIAAGFTLIAVAGIVFWVMLQRLKPIGLPHGKGDVTLALKEPFESSLTGSGIFAGRPLTDTAYVDGEWEDIGRGVIGSGHRISHLFREPGFHQIRRTIRSTRFRITNATDTTNVTVCGYLPRVKIAAPKGTQQAGAALQFRATVDTASPELKGFIWMVEGLDSSFRTEGSAPFTYAFDTAGLHTVYCRAYIPDNDYFCTRSTQTVVSVADTGRQYSIAFAGDGKPFQLKTEMRLWPGLAAALLCLAIIIGTVGATRKKKPKAERRSEAAVAATPPSKRGPPYEVPFAPVKPDDVITDKPLRRFLQLLRLKAEEEVLEMDVAKSIRATIRNGGLADAVLTPRRRMQDYLILIDKRAPHGMLHALYKHLADVMESEGVPVTRFYYDSDFICYNAQNPLGVRLRSIADNYAGSVPVILGDGQALLHTVAAGIKPELLAELKRWERCLLITPVQVNDWRAAREGILETHLSLSAADAAALEAAGHRLRSGAPAKQKLPSLPEGIGIKESQFNDIAFLKTYLGSDDAIFQWLCALAVYPKLRWEVTVAIGRAVLRRYGRESELRYDVLLQLCRIPWIAAGTFPQRLRAELLQALEGPNEVAARAALVALLQDVDRRYPGDYIFSAEKKLQSLMSRFVLYASDQAQFSVHEDAVKELTARIEAGTMADVPARKYLEHGDGNIYSTPLKNETGRSIGLLQFLQNHDAQLGAAAQSAARADRLRRTTRWMTAVCAIAAIIGAWCALRFYSGARSVPALYPLYSTDSAQLMKLSYSVKKDFSDCGDSSRDMRVLPGTLYVNGKAYGLSYIQQTKQLETNVPYRELGRQGANFRIMLGIGGRVAQQLDIDTLSPSGTITARCGYPPASSESTTLPDNYNEIWKGSISNRLVSINLEKGMIYYSTGSPKSYGSYRIDTVIQLNDEYHTYKVTTQAYPGYNVFFIHDATEGDISLCMCPTRYADKTSAQYARPSCGPFDGMMPYYEDFPNKVYLPVASGDGIEDAILPEQRKKVLDFIHNSNDAPSYELGYRLFRNQSFIRSHKDFDLKSVVADQYPNITTKLLGEQTMIAPNPFQRENLELTDLSRRERRRDVLGPPPQPSKSNQQKEQKSPKENNQPDKQQHLKR